MNLLEARVVPPAMEAAASAALPVCPCFKYYASSSTQWVKIQRQHNNEGVTGRESQFTVQYQYSTVHFSKKVNDGV